MGNIECILDEVNNLSDSDLKILVNKIMDRLKLEKAFASPAKVIPRMECPVCHNNAHVVRNGHKPGKQACGKSYVTTSNTLLACSHDSSVVWKTVLADTLMGVSLDDTRDGLKLRHIKISHTSLFLMRHKTMLALEDLQEISPAMIEDVVDIYTGHVKKGTLFLTDGMNADPKLGRALGLSIMNVKKETGSFFNLNTVNNLHSYIKNRYYDYRGVAAKYLNRYNLVFRAAYRMRLSVDELAEKLFLTCDPKRLHHYDDVKKLNLLAV